MKKIIKFIYLFILYLLLSGCNNIQSSGRHIYERDLKVYFINVGQADCTLIMLPNGENVLIDAGLDHATCYDENNFPSWNNIEKIFQLENINTIDHMIITHNHADHYYYVNDIIKQYEVEKIYVSGSTSSNYAYLKIMQTIEANNILLIEVYMGQNIIEDVDLTLQVLFTKKEDMPEDSNMCSIVTKLTYYKKTFLFMGDAGNKDGDIEPLLLKMNIDVDSDVLKVGHHGSAYASSINFLQKVTPMYSIITTASITSTGHPHKSALSRIETYSEKVLQSKIDGTILFVSNGETLDISTHIGE